MSERAELHTVYKFPVQGENHSWSGTLGSALPKSVRMWEAAGANCAFLFLLLPSVNSHTAHPPNLCLGATSHLKYPHISFFSLEMGTELCFPSSNCSVSKHFQHVQAVFQCKFTTLILATLGKPELFVTLHIPKVPAPQRMLFCSSVLNFTEVPSFFFPKLPNFAVSQAQLQHMNATNALTVLPGVG